MNYSKRLFAVMLMVVFAVGAAAGAIGTNLTLHENKAAVPVLGDSADLEPVLVPLDEPKQDIDNTQACPEVPVCPEPKPAALPKYREITMEEVQNIDFSIFGPEYSRFPELIPERDSPGDYIKEYQIHIYPDKVVIDVPNAILASFADTNSMDPVLDAGHNAIHVVPKRESDVQVGDIVSYKTEYGSIIHRIIEINQDEEGWYAIFKGDNNPVPDPGRIRFDQLQRKAVAIIY